MTFVMHVFKVISWRILFYLLMTDYKIYCKHTSLFIFWYYVMLK